MGTRALDTTGKNDAAAAQNTGLHLDSANAAVSRQPGDASSALINRLSETKNTDPVTGKPLSWLETGVDFVTSKFISNDKLRGTIDHYASEFIDTASLFAGGRVGVVAAAISYGLDQAHPGESARDTLEDFALGGAKGLAMKGLFSAVGTNFTFAPTKGIVMGVGMRAAQDVFQRDTLSDPASALARLSTDAFSKPSMLFDAATWTLGEGAFGGMNVATGGALVRNPLLGGIAMGSTFGVITGGGGEIMRETQSGEHLNLSKIVEQGLLEGAINGAAAGTGLYLTGTRTSNIDLSKVKRVDLPKVDSQLDGQPDVQSGTTADGATKIATGAGGGGTGETATDAAQTATDQAKSHSGSGKDSPMLTISLDANGDGHLKFSRPDLAVEQALAGSGDLAGATLVPKKAGAMAPRFTTVDSTDVPPPPAQTHEDPKQYVIVSGKEQLDAFRMGKSDTAMLKVRELMKAADGKGNGTGTGNGTEIGPQKTLFVQQLNGPEAKLSPQANKADLIATSYPEHLPEAEREHHVFGDAQGKVWVATDSQDRLLVGLNPNPEEVKSWKDSGFNVATRLDNGNATFNLMAPLMVGDAKNPDSPANKDQWSEFDRQLQEAKKLGAQSISTDVWWGLIEPEKGKFDWSYYDKMSDHIARAGLKWVPILSFHQCGGNVGDNVYVPLPDWVWPDLGSKLASKNPEDVKFKSEQGHTSNEYISFWADDIAKGNYEAVMKAFQDHFAPKASDISEVNVSLGPSGELRYPSYNSHDQNSGYPTRGALQAYSPLAEASFRQFALHKYGGIDGVSKAWNIQGLDAQHILPPSDAQSFYDQNNESNTQYGRDFIDWYNQSLIDHGKRLMTTAANVFDSKGAPFAGIDLGAKVPGVHWHVGQPGPNGTVNFGDRLAEINAGLIRTTDSDGFGYRPILSMFRAIQPNRNGMDSIIVPAFTCLEMPDGDGGPAVKAMPYTLAEMFGKEAELQGLWPKGENALAGNLGNPAAWDLMKSHLDLPNQNGYYHGLTLLRMSDVVNNPTARAKFADLVRSANGVPSWQQLFFRDPNGVPTWTQLFLRKAA